MSVHEGRPQDSNLQVAPGMSMSTMSWLFGIFSVGVAGFALGLTVGRILGTLETRARIRMQTVPLRQRVDRQTEKVD